MFTTFKENFQIQGRGSFDNCSRNDKLRQFKLMKNLRDISALCQVSNCDGVVL